jgi:hypothetical protein
MSSFGFGSLGVHPTVQQQRKDPHSKPTNFALPHFGASQGKQKDEFSQLSITPSAPAATQSKSKPTVNSITQADKQSVVDTLVGYADRLISVRPGYDGPEPDLEDFKKIINTGQTPAKRKQIFDDIYKKVLVGFNVEGTLKSDYDKVAAWLNKARPRKSK